jgi:hypothetical protein|tara:strand:+ start:402 stop:2585 length:2184 start_codon:yes stop_codon:yes gene_type:complete
MTVNSNTTVSGPFSGNGVTTNFSFNFRIESSDDIVVYKKDAQGIVTQLGLTSNYTLTGVGDDDGGVVVLNSALPADEELFIRANYIATQLTDFDSQGGFFPDVHEMSFDKLTFLVQQLYNRCLINSEEDFVGSSLNVLPPFTAGAVLVRQPDGSFANSTLSYSLNDDAIIASDYSAARGIVTVGLNDGTYIWINGYSHPWIKKTGWAALGAVDNGLYLVPNDYNVSTNDVYFQSTQSTPSIDIFGAELDGSTNDLQAHKKASAWADYIGQGVVVTMPSTNKSGNQSVMRIDASSDGDQVNWSNFLTYDSGKNSYKALPIILVDHADTYFFTEETSSADARTSGFGINGIEIKGYNASTSQRWDNDTTGGERNVSELWLCNDAQPQLTNYKMRNAVNLLHSVSTRSGNFPEQINLVGSVSDYDVAVLIDESGSGTGSHEHANIDLVITQGKKTSTVDACIKIVNGANLYRSNVKLRGRANDSGVTGAIIWVDGTGSTFKNNTKIDIALDRSVNTDLLRSTNDGEISRNQGTINGDSGSYSLGTDDFFQNNILSLGQEGVEIDGQAAPGTFQNQTTVMVASRAAANPLDMYMEDVSEKGLIVEDTVQGILHGRHFGNSTDKNTYRVVSITYYCATAPSGNTNSGWAMRINNATMSGGAAAVLDFTIPDGSSSGILFLDDSSDLLADHEFNESWFDGPLTVASRPLVASTRNDGTAPTDLYLKFALAKVK